MALLTIDELEYHIETDLPGDALQDVINGEEAEIVRRYGPHETATEEHPGYRRRLQLSRKPASITTVTEDGDALTSADYTLRAGFLLERAVRDWGQWVTVVYMPEDQTAQRRHVLIQLCKLSLAYTGYQSQQGPEVGERALDYHEEREKLLGSLAPRGGLFV